MCRSIKPLRHPDGPATGDEVQAAALQFVRKVSGYRIPSQANRAAFERAVAEIAVTTRQLLDDLVMPSVPRKDIGSPTQGALDTLPQ
jgi:hypothetical protein